MTPEEKAELFNFIKATGNYSFLPGGIHTYPGRDEENQKLFDACLELERDGLIYRTIDDPGHVYFSAKDELIIIIPCIFCGGQIRANPRIGENEPGRRDRAKRLLLAHQQICKG